MTRSAKKPKRAARRRTAKPAAKKAAPKKAAKKRAKMARKAPSRKSAAPSAARTSAAARPAASRARAARAIKAIDALARACFGTSAAARSWLEAPKQRLDGAAPADLLGSQQGRRQVRAWLEEIAAGGVG